jgi:RNA polymerase sigma-70 factor, ECF subfamily
VGTPTLDAFREACGAEAAAEAMSAAALERLLDQAQQAWPALPLDRRELAAALGRAVAGGIAAERLDAVEVALAGACAAHQPAALRAFEARYLAELPRVLGHMRLDPDVVAEVTQITRRRLLVEPGGGAPRLVTYAGHGQLRALVRVVATRAALDLRRSQGRRREVPVAELSAVLFASADPERAAAQGRKAEVFRAAFEAAVAELPPADRTLLRMYAIDGVGIDGLAAVAGIHRSTAARRLARIRAAIAAQTRARLQAAGLQQTELESVIGVIDEGLELTLSRILADPDPDRGEG